MSGWVTHSSIGVVWVVVKAALDERTGGDDCREDGVVGIGRLFASVDHLGRKVALVLAHSQS
ncbi:hypothetical protein D3C72_2245000 [compost metagenome]